MDFYAILDRVIDLLKQRERVTYRALKRQFDLDDAVLEDLKEELLFSHPVVEEDGRGLVWSGVPATPETENGRRGVSEGQFQTSLLAVATLLQRDQRVTYRTLKYAFGIEGELLTEIRDELSFRRLAIDEGGKGLVWTGAMAPSQHHTDVAATISPASPVREPHVGEIDDVTNGPPVTLENAPEAALFNQQITSPETAHRAAQAERRQLTVMFCDLVGSTDLSGRLDPEDLREVVRAYQDAAAEVVGRYEGHIAQYLGDGLLVYFGYPAAHENDAHRAMHAGLGMVEAVEALNTRLDARFSVELAVRIGIHTGPVVVGEMGGGERYENLALGETPNIAARLEALAAPNSVVISAVTARLAQRAFDLEDLGLHHLKGVSEPMRIARVIGPLEPEAIGPAMRGFDALVGRGEEIGLLLRRWAQTKEGIGQVVLLNGEAGIGKSSLVEGLRRHVRQEGYPRLAFRCSPYHTNSALYPIVETVQRMLDWQPDDSEDVKLTKLEQAFEGTDLPQDEAVPLVASLLSLELPATRYPALALPPQQQRQQAQDTLVAWVQQAAMRQPVLAVWEDLHWADSSTLELLGLFVDQAPTAAILHLLTFRPEFEPSWPSRSHITPITLNRLERPQVESLIMQMARGKTLPVEVIQHIVAKTDGVPLYVEELSKMFIESDLLCEETDRYTLTGSLATVSIPDSLQDSLMARLDQMHDAKNVAQLGSVLGREFSYEMLKAISSQDDQSLQLGLNKLVESELLYQRGRQPRTQYIFKHALIQDAAYYSILKSTRQQLHKQTAQFLISELSEHADIRPELVAHHYMEAGIYPQALVYWRQGGKEALDRSAYREAAACLEQAIAALAHCPETHETIEQAIDLRLDLRTALLPLREIERLIDVLRQAESDAEKLGDGRRLGWVSDYIASCFIQNDDLKSALRPAERALELATTHDDFAARISAEFRLAAVHFGSDDFYQAIALQENCIQSLVGDLVYERFGTVGVRSLMARGTIAMSLSMVGAFNEGRRRIEEGLQIAASIRDPFSEVFLFRGGGLLYLQQGDLPKAIPLLECAVAIHEEANILVYVNFTRALLAQAYALADRAEDAAPILDDVRDHVIASRGGNRAHMMAYLSEAFFHSGRLEDAMELAPQALKIAYQNNSRQSQVRVLRLLGDISLYGAENDEGKAETYYQQALTLAEELGMRPLQAHCHRGLGHLHSQTGQAEQARAELSTAIEMYRDMEMTFWLPETEMALAKVEGIIR